MCSDRDIQVLSLKSQLYDIIVEIEMLRDRLENLICVRKGLELELLELENKKQEGVVKCLK